MEYLKRRVLMPVCLCASVLAMQAQEYNPTVVVTNRYRAAAENAEKGEIEMAVPDSVRSFNMTFDYSVFDTPYRGSYEFSPYNVEMKPSLGGRRPGMFYLNAGIGYTLHPELDLVYTPVSNGRLSLDIYGNHRSFAGDYRKVGLDGERLTGLRDNGKRQYWRDWNYDMDNSAGAAFRYDWDRVGLTADLGYDGIQQRDWMRRRSLDRGSAGVRVFSKDTIGSVGFSTYIGYGFGHDGMVPKYGGERISVGENAFRAGVSVGVRTGKAGRFLLDMDASVASYMLGMQHTASLFSFTPHYLLNVKGWSFDLGVRTDIPVRSKDSGDESDAKHQYAYPMVKIAYDFQKVPLNIYLAVTGGERMNSYTSLVGEYRHYGISSAVLPEHAGTAVLGNSVERVKASFGLRGRIRSVFGYEAFVSYSERATSPLECVRLAAVDFGGGPETVPAYDLTFASSGLLTAGLDARYSDEWGRVDLGLRYNGLFVRGDVPQYVAPAALAGNAAVQFNIIKRIFVGVGCEFATVRRVYLADGSIRIPGFGEPYFSAEFLYSRGLSFWLKGSRLTGQTVQRTPLYAERGPELTAGVRLSFGK